MESRQITYLSEDFITQCKDPSQTPQNGKSKNTMLQTKFTILNRVQKTLLNHTVRNLYHSIQVIKTVVYLVCFCISWKIRIKMRIKIRLKLLSFSRISFNFLSCHQKFICNISSRTSILLGPLFIYQLNSSIHSWKPSSLKQKCRWT